MKLRSLLSLSMTVCALALSGCASYYEIRDPATGRTFYTTDIDRKGEAVMFEDANTGATVTLPASEVVRISRGEFKRSTHQ